MKSDKKYLHVCLTPALIDQFDVSQGVVVVIDILRATTSMCVALDNGADCIVPLEGIEETAVYKEKGYLIAGERSGEQISGFDMGNSPFSFGKEVVDGKRIAMTTTNGTKAIKAAQERGAKEILIGSFCNMSALVQWLIEKNEPVCLLCSGWRDHVNLEDTIFAGAMARKLRFNFKRYQDTVLMAESLFISATNRKRHFFYNSSHFQRLIHLNLQEEVKFALRRDTHPVIPILIGDELHDISHCKDDYEDFRQVILERQETERSAFPVAVLPGREE